MKMIQMLKNRNRTLLEMHTGILFCAFAASAAGLVLPIERWGMMRLMYLCSVWAAAAAAVLSTIHMQRSLDRALDMDEGAARKMITRGYLIRYALFVIAAVVIALVNMPDPLVFCLGYILLVKAAAYLQPFTHKLYNKLFRETDPVPEPVSDEEWNSEKN